MNSRLSPKAEGLINAAIVLLNEATYEFTRYSLRSEDEHRRYMVVADAHDALTEMVEEAMV